MHGLKFHVNAKYFIFINQAEKMLKYINMFQNAKNIPTGDTYLENINANITQY